MCTQFGMGFNRNIVECKVAPAFFSVTYKDRFNRNIVECKVMQFKKIRIRKAF